MNELLIKMVDGGLIDYQDDCYHFSGCPTCDYGSKYINEMYIKLFNYIIYVKVNQMYEYAISQGDVIKLFLCNYNAIQAMTEKEFVDWLKNKLYEIVDSDCLKEYVVTER